MLDKETFLEALKGQYRDDIQMLITECQHDGKTFLDVEMLNENLSKIHHYALNSGLTEDDWLGLIYELTPEIYNKIDFDYSIAA